MIFLTSPGKTYSVNSVSGCTISVGGTTLTTIPANVQTTFIAPEDAVIVSDNNAIIVEVTGVGAGGSGGSGEGGSGGVTAEEIKAVVPIAWGSYTTAPTAQALSVALGNKSNASLYSVSIGDDSQSGESSTVVGNTAKAYNSNTCVFGYNANTNKSRTVTIGSLFYEYVDGKSEKRECQTQGTGSITIGAGANTLNNGDTESSNSVTIGCKASNSGADSVVIGAGASTTAAGGVTIGAGATNVGKAIVIGNGAATNYNNGVAIGYTAKIRSSNNVCVGDQSTAEYNSTVVGAYNEAINDSVVVGYGSKALGASSIAIGRRATTSDIGTAVIAVLDNTAQNYTTKTQLYFAGANTPLAQQYYNGEAFMGYTVTDSTGKNVLACGTRRLSELFPDNSLTQPASLDENGEWVQPKVFRPSDVDLPVEEPTEPEEYTPLPVYPIVEPEIEEIPSES